MPPAANHADPEHPVAAYQMMVLAFDQFARRLAQEEPGKVVAALERVQSDVEISDAVPLMTIKDRAEILKLIDRLIVAGEKLAGLDQDPQKAAPKG